MSDQTDQKALKRARVTGLGWAIWRWSFARKRWVCHSFGDWLTLWPCRRMAREDARYLRSLGTPTRVRRVQLAPPERRADR